MRELYCAVCNSSRYRVRYPERIPSLKTLDFSARRAPQKHHAQMVECVNCGLVYSNPYFDDNLLRTLYQDAAYIDEQQLENMAADYFRAFSGAVEHLDHHIRILEIGCANGFFLRRLANAGYSDIVGIEPGKDAVEHAEPSIRNHIINAFMQPGLFSPASFDAVCCFQIFDHLPDPNSFLREVHTILKPGGILLAINHNIRALVTKILGEKSPMYDIEHIYLFDKKTIRQILSANGFAVTLVANLTNSYTLGYAVKMFPLQPPLKRAITRALEVAAINTLTFRIPAGNMVSVARKES